MRPRSVAISRGTSSRATPVGACRTPRRRSLPMPDETRPTTIRVMSADTVHAALLAQAVTASGESGRLAGLQRRLVALGVALAAARMETQQERDRAVRAEARVTRLQEAQLQVYAHWQREQQRANRLAGQLAALQRRLEAPRRTPAWRRALRWLWRGRCASCTPL